MSSGDFPEINGIAVGTTLAVVPADAWIAASPIPTFLTEEFELWKPASYS